MWSYRILVDTLKLPNVPDFNEAFGRTALMYREVEVLCFRYKKRQKKNVKYVHRVGEQLHRSVYVQLLKDA